MGSPCSIRLSTTIRTTSSNILESFLFGVAPGSSPLPNQKRALRVPAILIGFYNNIEGIRLHGIRFTCSVGASDRHVNAPLLEGDRNTRSLGQSPPVGDRRRVQPCTIASAALKSAQQRDSENYPFGS